MAVDLHCKGSGGVAQPVLHHTRMDPGPNQTEVQNHPAGGAT